jgi:hypothetical protein
MKRALPVTVCLFALSCGYHFTSAGAGFPQGIHKVFAPVIINRTTEPGLEGAFTEALREQLSRGGYLGGEGSEGRIEGELLSVSGAPAQLGPGTSSALTYRVAAVLRVRLYKDHTLLAQTDVTGTEDYLPALRPDVITTEANRQAAIRRLASALATDAVTRLQSG